MLVWRRGERFPYEHSGCRGNPEQKGAAGFMPIGARGFSTHCILVFVHHRAILGQERCQVLSIW